MPKTIDHDQRRRDIIDVTLRLIVQGGLEAATMREIAAEAGFANGALKHYFPGKDDIIKGAYHLTIDRLAQRLAEATEDLDGITALRATITTTMPVDDESRDSARVLLSFWEQGLSSESVRSAYREHLSAWHDLLLGLIARCREQGVVTATSLDEDLAREVISMTVGAIVLSAIAPDFADRASVEKMIADFFARLGVPAQ